MTVERGVSTAIALADPTGVGEVRRFAMTLAKRLGFDEVEREHVAIVATELASNVVKHGGGGEVLLRALGAVEPHGLELLAIDRGPGMSDVGRSMSDGFSTSGTPGTGLGAGSRLSTTFEVQSSPGSGTVVLARIRDGRPSIGVRVGAVCVPKKGEEVCGDGWGLTITGATVTVMVADGLGHGPLAADASRAAVDVLAAYPERAPAEILELANGALRSTRGAAIAVAAIDLNARIVRYAGVGNISGTIVTPDASRQLVSHNGTVGQDTRRAQELVYPFPQSARIIMNSDGLGSHWRLDRYPGMALRHPALIAGVLYRDFNRGRDDVSVVALAESAP